MKHKLFASVDVELGTSLIERLKHVRPKITIDINDGSEKIYVMNYDGLFHKAAENKKLERTKGWKSHGKHIYDDAV